MSKITSNQVSSVSTVGDDACTPRCAKLSYAIMLLGVVLLAASGIGSFVTNNVPMREWVLMMHVGSGPVFAIGLALVALTWSDRSRFGCDAPKQSCFAKAMFWLILLSGLVVLLSAVVPMTPLFGTHGEHTLYLTHRYSAFVLTGAVVLHLLSLRRKCA